MHDDQLTWWTLLPDWWLGICRPFATSPELPKTCAMNCAERKAAHEHHALLAERGEDPVVLLRDEAGRDRHRLLPRARAVEADAALALQQDHPRVEDAKATHVAVARRGRLGRDLRIGRRVGRAVLAEDGEQPDVGIGVAQRGVGLE